MPQFFSQAWFYDMLNIQAHIFQKKKSCFKFLLNLFKLKQNYSSIYPW